MEIVLIRVPVRISLDVPLAELPGGPVVVAEVGTSVVVPRGLVGGGHVVLEGVCLRIDGDAGSVLLLLHLLEQVCSLPCRAL